MIGGFGLHPILVTIVSDIIDARLVADAFTSRLIVNGEGGVDDDIEQILSEKIPGMILVIQGIAGQTHTIKHLAKGGGDEDIRTPDGGDFLLVDEHNITVIYDAVNNEWAFMDGALGGVGANRQLSNLLTTAVNTNILPDANTIHDLGSELLGWDIIYARQFEINVSSSVPTPSSDDIITRTDTPVRVINFNVKAAISRFDFRHLGIIGMSIRKDSAGDIIIDPDTVSVGLQIALQPVATNPAINGVIRHITGGDVKVFSGGALRNFSDIVPIGATRELDNLLVTSINADLLFANPNLDIGTSGTPLDSLNAKRITIIAGGALITGNVMIRNFAGDMEFNVPLNTDGYRFKWIGVNDVSITFDGVNSKIDVDDVNAGLQLTLQPQGTNPAIDGIMRHLTGGDVKVFSGGTLRNFTQMAQKDAVESITGLWTFTNSTINLNNANINLGDGTGDVIGGLARFARDLIPSTDNARDLGSPTLAWDKIYCGDASSSRLRIPVGANLFD